MKDQNSIRQAIRAFGILSGVGIYIAVVILICLYLGSLADDFFGLDGVGKLIGIFSAFPIAFYSIYRQLKRGEFF